MTWCGALASTVEAGPLGHRSGDRGIGVPGSDGDRADPGLPRGRAGGPDSVAPSTTTSTRPRHPGSVRVGDRSCVGVDRVDRAATPQPLRPGLDPVPSTCERLWRRGAPVLHRPWIARGARRLTLATASTMTQPATASRGHLALLLRGRHEPLVVPEQVRGAGGRVGRDDLARAVEGEPGLLPGSRFGSSRAGVCPAAMGSGSRDDGSAQPRGPARVRRSRGLSVRQAEQGLRQPFHQAQCPDALPHQRTDVPRVSPCASHSKRHRPTSTLPVTGGMKSSARSDDR